nr:VCBS repeat-containing protein [Bacteroidota bacterium]
MRFIRPYLFSLLIILSFKSRSQNPFCFNGLSDNDFYLNGIANFNRLESIDLNYDGYLDIISRDNITGTNINVYYGNSSANYSIPVTFTVGGAISNILLADFNNDGIIDLFCAAGGNLTVLPGNTLGGFNGPIFSQSVGTPFKVATGDFNNDGKKDIALMYSSSIQLYLGTGNCTFIANGSNGFISSTSNFFNDLNNDGKTDAFATANKIISVFQTNTFGYMNPSASYTLGANIPDGCVINKDFNNDGYLDIIATNSLAINVLFNDGTGNFLAPVIYLAPSTSIKSITDGDFNNDGYLDLAVANYSLKTITTYTNNGAGVFSGATNIYAGNLPFKIISKDLNNDGNADLVGLNYTGAFRFLGNGTGGFGTASFFAVGKQYINIHGIADYNNDGNVDIAIAEINSSNSLVIIKGKGSGDFNSSDNFETIDNPGASRIISDDFNNDLKKDVAVLDYDSAKVSIYAGNNNGKLNKITSFTVPASPAMMVSGDFDNDGYKDIAVSGMAFGVFIYKGSASGTFSYFSGVGIPYAGGLDKGDFNEDGKIDLVVTNYGNNTVWPLLGNGNAGFASSAGFSAGNCPSIVIAKDFNNDSHLDLSIMSSCGGAETLTVLFGNGASGFSAATSYSLGVSSQDQKSADFNNDGHPDIAVSNSYGGNLSVLLGSASGNFTSNILYALGSTVSDGLVTGDFNNDGNTDIAIASIGTRILKGNGNGTFSLSTSYYLGGNGSAYVAEDFNNDGALDIVSSAIGVLLSKAPVISISGLNTACIGSTIALTASGANSYSWSTSATGPTILVNPTVTTTYTVTGINGTGCSNVAVKTISVIPFTASTLNITGANTLCSTYATTLTANGASTYTWSTGSNGSAISVNPIINTTYNVTGTDANGCPNSAQKTITVAALPIVNITGTTVACANSPISFTASGASSYTWSTGSNATVMVTTPTITTIYSVAGTGTNGCVKTSTYNVNVFSTPTMVISSATTAICKGSSLTLTGSGSPTYTWSTGPTTQTISVSPVINSTYTLSGNTGFCIGSKTIQVSVNPLPTVTVNNPVICTGGTATLTAGGANSYTWSTSAITNSIIDSPPITTTYTVTGTNSFGCIKTNIATIYVAAPVNASITASAPSVCTGGSVTLTAGGINTFTWNTNQNSVSIIVTPIVATTYTVSGVVGSCPGTTTISIGVDQPPTTALAGSNQTICINNPAITLSG